MNSSSLIVASGIRNIEITSFVNPKAIPQFGDASQMAQAVLKMKPEGVEVSALVPNLKGAQIALESGMRKLGFVMSVSESHNISNVRRTTDESMDELKKILELKANYPDLEHKAGMATRFRLPLRRKDQTRGDPKFHPPVLPARAAAHVHGGYRGLWKPPER